MTSVSSFRALRPEAVPHSSYDPRISTLGQGPPLILVAGMDGTGTLFYRQQPLLARSFRATTYALRENAASMAELVADLDAVIDDASPDRSPAIVVGESFGGALALSFALARPDRVAGLVIVNSFAHFLPQTRLRLAIWGLELMPWGAMAVVRRATAFRLHSRYTHRTEVRRFLALSRHITRAGYIGRLKILRDYDVRERLAEIATPTLFLAADRDHLVPAVREARYMAERLPGAKLQILDGHGHICLIAPGIDLEAIIRDWRAGLHRPRVGRPAW